jgi:hypothetical protein
LTEYKVDKLEVGQNRRWTEQKVDRIDGGQNAGRRWKE